MTSEFQVLFAPRPSASHGRDRVEVRAGCSDHRASHTVRAISAEHGAQRGPRFGSFRTADANGCDADKNGLCNKYALLVTRPWEVEKIYEVGEGKGISRQKFKDGQPKFHAGFCWDGMVETLAAFRVRIADLPGCRVVVSSGRYIDVIPEQFGKGQVVRFLQEGLKVDRARVVVAGDSGNDMEMFETDFNGVVPENAFAELKLFARQGRHYHSAFPAALGVLDGLRHFGLVKPVHWWSR